MGSKKSNPGRHACKASTLLNEISPKPIGCQFWEGGKVDCPRSFRSSSHSPLASPDAGEQAFSHILTTGIWWRSIATWGFSCPWVPWALPRAPIAVGSWHPFACTLGLRWFIIEFCFNTSCRFEALLEVVSVFA